MRLSKQTAFISMCLGTLVLVAAAASEWQYDRFSRAEVQRQTGIKQFQFKRKEHSSRFWYAAVEISPLDGTILLKRQGWRAGFNKEEVLAGMTVLDLPADCPSCWYRLEHVRDLHGFNYNLMVLDPSMQRLQIVEVFGG